ncbi:TonB-dependent receptor domain-containing protein [Sphingobium sp. MK2]|uniref:TonB-dependent receptor n=1 Tax=Sphingobium sp. MK2 TaxID=3116540 RepID=UPI0032E36440
MSATPALAQNAEAESVQTGIQDIIVTAQKREESAQKAALAISVVSSESLVQAGVTSVTDLGKVVPAVKVSQAASPYVPINIRGIANFALNAYSDPAAVVSYDGVALSRPSGLFGNLYDLARVEVLKGPQGTLYGRNATAGALNILPAPPKLGEFSGNGMFEYGNFDLIHATGAINLPLGTKAALRIAGDFIDRDGYYADGTSDQVSRSVRAQLRVEPDDRFAITLGADFSHQGGRGPGMSLLEGTYVAGTYPGPAAILNPRVGQYVGDPWDGLNSAASCPTHAAYYGNVTAICKNDSYQDSDFWGVNATIDWDVGFGTLTVLPAYRRSSLNYHVNSYPNLEEHQTHEQTSLEVRLSSQPSSPVKWVLGAFAFDEDTDSNFLIRLNPLFPPTTQLVDASTKSYAAFGQVTVPLTDGFRATGGVRYTSDKKTFDGLQPPNPRQAGLKRSDSAVTWKVGLEYDVSANSLLYAGVDRGYHSGGFFFTAGPRATYEPEQITSYTIGSKNMLFNRRLQLNLEAFWYDYKDQQVSHFAVILDGGGLPSPGFVTDNAGNAEIKGVEADIRWLATDTTNLFLNAQYLDAKYTKFQYSTGFAPQTTGCPPLGQVGGEFIYNCNGYPMINAPKWSLTGGIEQTFELANGSSFVANVGGQFQSSVWLAPFDYLPFHSQGSKFIGDASLTYNTPGRNWSITGWVRNFTDAVVSDFKAGTGSAQRMGPPGPALSPGSVPVSVLRPPRTYGVRVNVNF